MKSVYFPMIFTTVTHPNYWTVIELWRKKGFISKGGFNKFIKDVYLANACIFLLAFLHKSVKCWSNVNFEWNLTSKIFLRSIFFIWKRFTFKHTLWLVLTRKWPLLALPFKRFFSSHVSKDTEACFRDSTTSTFLAER